MARIAADTFLLGLHGEIHAGDEVPETYTVAAVPGEQQTDFDRLDELGVLEPEADKPKAKGKGAAKKADQPDA